MKNWGGLRHLSIEKKLNVPKVLIDSDREKILRRMSIFLLNLNRIFMDLQGKNWFLGLSESPSDLCYYTMNFKK